MVRQAGTKAAKVPFNVDTITACICPGCPVQAKSKCVAGLKKGVNAALKKSPLNAAEIPGDYCASGKAACTDLDPSQSCICGDCSLYTQYKLGKGKPGGYYCAEGAAR